MINAMKFRLIMSFIIDGIVMSAPRSCNKPTHELVALGVFLGVYLSPRLCSDVVRLPASGCSVLEQHRTAQLRRARSAKLGVFAVQFFGVPIPLIRESARRGAADNYGQTATDPSLALTRASVPHNLSVSYPSRAATSSQPAAAPHPPPPRL